jgi:hypothetical protein
MRTPAATPSLTNSRAARACLGGEPTSSRNTTEVSRPMRVTLSDPTIAARLLDTSPDGGAIVPLALRVTL